MRQIIIFIFFVRCIPCSLLYAQSNSMSWSEYSELSFNQVQFKSTHNSYQRPHSPHDQIDLYNVWDIELDFGLKNNSNTFIVGHNYPEPRFGLYSLEDWIKNITSANSFRYHPIIIKLEAKTVDTSTWWNPLDHWDWLPGEQWGNWQAKLRLEIESWIGAENIITQAEFESDYGAIWPAVKELSGKVIITLQDHNNLYTREDSFFFISSVPGLLDCYPLIIGSPSDLGRSIKSAFQRLLMDDGYLEPWSNVLVHPPLPMYVSKSGSNWQFGTPGQPFVSVGHAINSIWTRNGEPSEATINLYAGTYNEKITISTPAKLHAIDGPVIIGSGNCSYTIILHLIDADDTETDSPVFATLGGLYGSTAEYPLANPTTYFDRAAADCFLLTGPDIGPLQSITIRVGGGDDMGIEDIYVFSATSGRYFTNVNTWVGPDVGGAIKTFNF